jgi:hypothetical protein
MTTIRTDRRTWLQYLSNLLVPERKRTGDFRVRLLMTIAAILTLSVVLNLIKHAGSYSGMYIGGNIRGICLEEDLIGFPWAITIDGLRTGNFIQLSPYFLIGNFFCNVSYFAVLTVITLRLVHARIFLSEWFLYCLLMAVISFASLVSRQAESVAVLSKSLNVVGWPFTAMVNSPSTGSMIHVVAFNVLTCTMAFVCFYALARFIAARYGAKPVPGPVNTHV